MDTSAVALPSARVTYRGATTSPDPALRSTRPAYDVTMSPLASRAVRVIGNGTLTVCTTGISLNVKCVTATPGGGAVPDWVTVKSTALGVAPGAMTRILPTRMAVFGFASYARRTTPPLIPLDPAVTLSHEDP